MISSSGLLPQTQTRIWVKPSSRGSWTSIDSWMAVPNGLELMDSGTVSVTEVSARLWALAVAQVGRKGHRSSPTGCHRRRYYSQLVISTVRFSYGARSGSSASGGAASQLTATFMSELLESGALQQHISQVLQPAYARRYTTMLEAITDILVPLGVAIKPPDREVFGGYFLWLSLPDPLRADDLVTRAQREENLIVGGGSLFGVYGDVSTVELKDKVRVCFAWEEEDVFREGTERLGRVIKRMQNASMNCGSAMNHETEGAGQEKYW